MNDEKKPKSLLVDDLRKRIEEIERSNNFNSQANQPYFIPRREKIRPIETIKKPFKDKKNNQSQSNGVDAFQRNENNGVILKPRKNIENPFTPSQQEQITNSLEEIRTAHNERTKFLHKEEKRLAKDQNRIIKKISKFDKKIDYYNSRGKQSEVEKTIEMKAHLAEQLKDIQENFKNITSSFTPEMSLDERRRKIYSNAYKAETNRVRKLIDDRQNPKSKRYLGWENHVDYTRSIKPDKNAAPIPERKREKNWEEDINE